MRYALLTLALLTLTACGSLGIPKPKMPSMPKVSLPKVDIPFVGRKAVEVPGVTPDIEESQWSPYPRNAAYGDDLDIVVNQARHSVSLLNREPRAFNNMQLWLNQQYVATIPQIPIGHGPSVDLISFKNRHDETFPEPAFLKPEKGYPVVSAELFNPDTGKRHRLLARGR